MKYKYYQLILYNNIKEYIKGYNIYQKVKAIYYYKVNKIQALFLLLKLFESISIDFITDLPPSINKTIDRTYNSLLVIIDRYTKTTKFILYFKTTSIEDIAELFIKYQFKDYRILNNIILNRDIYFISKFQSTLYYYLAIRYNLSTIYYS